MPPYSTLVLKRKYSGKYQKTAKKLKMYSAPTTKWGQSRSVVQEANFLDFNATAVTNTSGSVTLLNGMIYGTGASQHIGLKVILKSLEFHVRLINDPAAVLNWATVWLVYDNNPNGTTPAFSNIITSGEFISLQNRDRFKIMKRMNFMLVGNSTTFTEKTIAEERGFLPVNEDMLFNSGSAGTIADIQAGALYMLTYGSNVVGTTDCSTDITCRTRFIA